MNIRILLLILNESMISWLSAKLALSYDYEDSTGVSSCWGSRQSPTSRRQLYINIHAYCIKGKVVPAGRVSNPQFNCCHEILNSRSLASKRSSCKIIQLLLPKFYSASSERNIANIRDNINTYQRESREQAQKFIKVSHSQK